MPKKEISFEEKNFKIWLEDDGILRIKLGREINDMVLEMLNISFKEVGKQVSGKVRALVDLNLAPHVPSSTFRRKGIALIKDTLKDPGYEKIALFGGGKIQKTVAYFVIVASKIKNIKYFNTEKEALKWLKQ